jgi:predicted alpha/beta hydrolase
MMMTPGIGEGYPVVLLIAGSGPTDMNGNSMQLGIQPNTLKLIAEGLAKKGIATVRFDKRGIASSVAAAKDEFSLRFDDYVNDVRLWIDKLAGDRRF